MEEKDRALMWLGFLPQCLQRKPTRGSKIGRAQVAHRYHCYSQGDWGSLVILWERDRNGLLRKKRTNRRQQDKDEQQEVVELARQRQVVLGLISSGQVGKAMQRVNLYGLGDINDPNILEQLRVKFPTRLDQLPTSVPKVKPIDSFRSLRECPWNLVLHQELEPSDLNT